MSQPSSPFMQTLQKRVDQLMHQFREADAALPPNTDKQPFVALFREIFALNQMIQNQDQALPTSNPGMDDRERQFELLYKAGLALNGQTNPETLLNLALDTLLEMATCHRGFIATVDFKGNLNFVAARNFQGGTIPQPEQEISKTVIQRAWKFKQEVQWDGEQRLDESMLQKSSIMRREGGALLCIPIFQEQEVGGVIYLDQFPHSLTLGKAQLARNFATQLAAFMKQASLFESLQQNSQQLMDQLKNQYRFDAIVGKNKQMVNLLQSVGKVAQTQASMLIIGETGTGKDLVARAIHENSPRAKGPYIEVDCGALAENLVESELFGHGRGAFTGAVDEKLGLLAAAHGGTLFLDEINNLSMPIQIKLLRALQQRKIRRIGETRERAVDFRLIAASSKDLEAMAKAETFRQDLLYRINTVTLNIPPLRERKDDIVLLAQSFLEKFANVYSKETMSFSPAALQALESHAWPGNVRELEHVVERAVILGEGHRLEARDFPFSQGEFEDQTGEETMSLEAYLQNAKKYYVTKILKENNGKKVDAAKQLQVNRSHLFQLIKQLGIDS